ncbi:hypothetical protein [Bacillus sp. OK048]|nr:hypothetical protein [Bacillus sp. OK048]SDN02703.1 hypothetical protein SAMN05443253_107203 [Bacillus sp. OK048]
MTMASLATGFYSHFWGIELIIQVNKGVWQVRGSIWQVRIRG